MDFQSEIQTLSRLGLLLNHARVYVTLFRLGASKVKIISKTSGVERSETYRIMEKLEKLGLVERIVSVPYKFRAIPISDAFDILMEYRMKETSELQAATREIAKKFKNSSARMALKKDQDQTRFSLVPEQAAVRGKERTLDNLQRSFDVVTSWRNPHSVILVDIEEMDKALQRDVRIRVIADKPDEEKSAVSDTIKYLTKHPIFKIRYLLNAPKALIEIFDKKEAWICTCTNPMLEECPFLRTNNPCLLSILQDYFEILWVTAMERKHQDPPQT